MLDLDQLHAIAEALQCKIVSLEAILQAVGELTPVQQDNAAFFTDAWRSKLQRQRAALDAVQTLIKHAQPQEQVTA